MINLLERYLPFYDSEGGSGAGDGNGDGGDKGGENDSSGAGAAPSVDGGKAGADGVVGSPEASAEIYRPKGVAETMFGKTNEETIDKMATTINGYRNKENSKPGVPSEIGDYKIGDVPDDLKTYFGNLENDPIWDGMRVHAMKHDMNTEQFSGFITDVVSDWAGSGMLSEMVDDNAERTALIPDEAQYLTPAEQVVAVNARMQDNIDWVEKVGPQHGFDKDMGEFLIESMGDRAQGHKAIEVIRKLASGAPNPLNFENGKNGESLNAQLNEREADPRNDPSSPKYQKAFAEETNRMWQQPGAAGN